MQLEFNLEAVIGKVNIFREFIFSRDMLFGTDTLELGYMARAFFAERLAAGDFPLWSPRLLGGIPFIEALAAGDSIYPTSLLYFIMEPFCAQDEHCDISKRAKCA